MKGSLIVVGFFALGCLLGWSGWLPDVVIENDITVYVLYLLMFQVGINSVNNKSCFMVILYLCFLRAKIYNCG